MPSTDKSTVSSVIAAAAAARLARPRIHRAQRTAFGGHDFVAFADASAAS